MLADPTAARFFANPFAELSPTQLINAIDLALLKTHLRSLLHSLLLHVKHDLAADQPVGGSHGGVLPHGSEDYPSTDVYKGPPGVALLFWRLSQCGPELLGDLDVGPLSHDEPKEPRTRLLQQARTLLDNALKNTSDFHREQDFSFLMGKAGLYAVSAAVANDSGDADLAMRHRNKLLDLAKKNLDSSRVPDELLYGRSGYLYSMEFVAKHGGGMENPAWLALAKQTAHNVTRVMFRRGLDLAEERFPLMFYWHQKRYLGAAHGLAGIANSLLLPVTFSTLSKEEQQYPFAILKSVVSLQSRETGNFPSSLENAETDLLVQFCHGAPGICMALAKAESMRPSALESSPVSELLAALANSPPPHLPSLAVKAEQTGHTAPKSFAPAIVRGLSCVWSRGILCKGASLCHGIGGNAYAFLSVHAGVLAGAFAMSLVNENIRRDFASSADHPFSLFEGIVGEAYFLVEYLDYELNSRAPAFPGFSI